jgi:hypothetical protein
VKQRTASRIAWGAFLVFLVGAALVLWLQVRIQGWGDAAEDFVMVLIFASFGVVGALVASRQPRNAIGWIFLAITLAVVVAGLSDTYAQYSFRVRATPLPGGGASPGWPGSSRYWSSRASLWHLDRWRATASPTRSGCRLFAEWLGSWRARASC